MNKTTTGSIIDLQLNKSRDGFDMSVYVAETNDQGLPLFEQAISTISLNLYKYENRTIVSTRDESKLEWMNEFMLSKFDLTFDEMLDEFNKGDINPFEENEKDRSVTLYYNSNLLPRAVFYLKESSGASFKKYDSVKENRKGNSGSIAGITTIDGRLAIEVVSTKENTVSQENGTFLVKLPGALYITPNRWVNGKMTIVKDSNGNPLPNTVNASKLTQTLATMLMLFGTINPSDIEGKELEYSIIGGTRQYALPKKVTPLSDECENKVTEVYDDVTEMLNTTKGKFQLIPGLYKKYLSTIVPETVSIEIIENLRVGEDLNA